MKKFINDCNANIASTVIMPGDPLRAKYIANNYLDGVVEINISYGMVGYTGFYNDKKVSVISSGMGIPSIAKFAYELYVDYNVFSIIRIGTCGKYSSEISIGDVINVYESYSDSSFAKVAYNYNSSYCKSSKNQFEKLDSHSNGILKTGNIYTSDVFYRNKDKVSNKKIIDLGLIAADNEAFGLFVVANNLNKQSGCLLTVFGSCVGKEKVRLNARQEGLIKMIEIALEAA